MFKPYVNHAAQYLAERGGVAGKGAFPNKLHFTRLALQSSINITNLIENATRKEFARKAAKTQKE